MRCVVDLAEHLIVSGGTVVTGGMSLWVAMRKSALHRKSTSEHNRTEHTETLLGGYTQIVEDLRGEIDRLNNVIIDLRKEQEECERRNEEMAKVVNELKLRVGFLESGKNGQ